MMKRIIAIIAIIGILSPVQVSYAARLWSSGVESASVTSEQEFYAVLGTPTIDTSIVRSGTYSLHADANVAETSTGFQQYATGGVVNGPFFVRAYVRIETNVNQKADIIKIETNSAARVASIELQTDNTLKVRNNTNYLIGGLASPLSTGVWYQIELYAFRIDGSNMGITGRVDGSAFASTSTASQVNQMQRVRFGILETTATVGDVYFDDMAINDANGGVQNGFPGAGSIVQARPSSAGDIDDCSEAGAGWPLIDEITPNDSTDYCTLTATNKTIDVNASSSAQLGIPANSSITLVQVGDRISKGSGTSSNNVILRIKSQSNGTLKTQSTTNGGAESVWYTMDDTVPRNYPLTAYVDPQTNLRWTTGKIDTMQFGASTTDANPNVLISTIWALIEYSDPLVPTTGTIVRAGGGKRSIIKGAWVRILSYFF